MLTDSSAGIGEYENLDELNYLASKLEELGESEYGVSSGTGKPD